MKAQKSFFEQNGGTYTQVGDVLLPNLSIGEAEQRPIGKYCRMRKRYLKEQHPVIFSELLLTGKLYPHLLEIDEACEGRMELLVLQMAKNEGATEALKAADQMEWVARMNSIRNRAEEIVLSELIYTEEAEDADS
ncbi:MAG: TnpV protein [Oscillospiraceae bacterium]|nr:TnpV protein [Oscillospiraceae bacterium]